MSKTGKLWIASIDKGLFLFDPLSNNSRNIDFERFGVENDRVSSMFEDQEGTIWLGSFGKGVYEIQIKNDEIKNIKLYSHNPSDRNSLSYDQVCDLIRPVIVDTNAVWIATANGMNRYDLKTKSFTHFFEKDGIPDNYVVQVQEDNSGNIWITCSIGLAKYDIKTRLWKSYSIADGMPFENFGGCRQNNVKGPDGQLFFSGGSGTIGFYPEQIRDNPIIPPIRLTDFRIFNESVKLDTSIVFKKVINLSYDQNAFSFEFAALNYTNPGKNQYAYKIEGFHDDWVYTGNEHKASFTNLDPGEYIFRVKGSNNHGIWNEAGASLKIIILPPWWATKWAYLVYASLFVAILFFGLQFEIRRRQHKIEAQIQKEKELRKLKEAEHRAIVAELQSKATEAEKEKEKEQMRSRIASDLHDEIGSNLSSIDLMGQVLHSKLTGTDQDKKKLRDISQIARMTAESMREIIWFVNPKNDSMEKLIVKMRDTANLMLN
jgi:hypothetical protein